MGETGNVAVEKTLKYRHVVVCINGCHYIWFVCLEIIEDYYGVGCRAFLAGRIHPLVFISLFAYFVAIFPGERTCRWTVLALPG